MGPPGEGMLGGPEAPPTGRTTNTHRPSPKTSTPDSNGSTPRAVSSQQVSWWSVHEHVVPLLESVGSWPMVGTPAWCALNADDPAKLAAIYDAAQHWSLRLETAQEAACQASRDISAAEDWSARSREVLVRRAFYDARPWLRRVVT